MADLVSDVTALCRSILNDGGGVVFTDALLIPFVASGYRDLQRDLAVRGVKTFSDYAFIVMAAGGTQLKDNPTGSDAALPADFLYPYQLWERTTGLSTGYNQMQGPLPGPIPQRDVLGPSLDYWEFTGDAIRTTGASGSVDLKMKYEKALAKLSAIGNPILIRDAVDALAHKAAAKATRSRGQRSLAGDLNNEYLKLMQDLASRDNRPKQGVPVRRRPYSARYRANSRRF